MNFKFFKNTKLASLLMVSLTLLPNTTTAAFLKKKVNNSFYINEVATNGSSITKKISNISNGYIFTQFGHNTSINSFNIKNPKGSLYADLAYRRLYNNNYYTNFGAGVKIGLLAKEKYRSSIENTNINIDGFYGIKHKIGIESSIQFDYTLKKDIFSLGGNANQGVIFNIKYNNKNDYRFKWASISLETGYSNLYTLANKGQSLFGIIRFNTKGIISYLGEIGKQINNYFNLQILIGSIQKEGFRSDIELKLGIMEKDKSITEGYYELESIYKNNTIEYGYSDDNLEEKDRRITDVHPDDNLEEKDRRITDVHPDDNLKEKDRRITDVHPDDNLKEKDRRITDVDSVDNLESAVPTVPEQQSETVEQNAQVAVPKHLQSNNLKQLNKMHK